MDIRISAYAVFHELFRAQASKTPGAVAIVCEDEELTYGELDRRSSALAVSLAGRGAAVDRPVGLLVERSVEMIVGLLAIMKAGAAYLPIDPAAPPERIRFLLEDSRASLLLAQRALAPPAALPCPTRFFDETADGNGVVPPAVASANLAYVIYTSGSTGRPKGVAVEHRQLMSYVCAIVDRMQPSLPSSFALVSTLAADLGHTAVFPALATGATLHIISSDRIGDGVALGAYMRGRAVECMKIVPSHLSALLAAAPEGDVLPTKLLIVGGESSSRELVDQVRALAPACAILNHYGPTETTVGVLTYPVAEGRLESDALPLGTPLPNAAVYVLDESLQPVGRGTVGEICIGGASVARGYIGSPDLTAERFVPDLFSTAGRLYRTGDRGRVRADGAIEFLGRSDHQVKIRGYRVELREIETALMRHAGVHAAVVVARDGGVLAAYVVPRERGCNLEKPLRAALRSELPEYMVPSVWVRLDALPLNANGKLDRHALPAPGAASTPYRAPSTPTEVTMAVIWSDVLGVARAGLDDRFSDLGGHSLLGIRILSRIREHFGKVVAFRALLTADTLAATVKLVERAPRDNEKAIVRLGAGTAPLSSGQQRLWLLHQMFDDHRLYNVPAALRLCGPLDRSKLERALSAIVQRHEALRTAVRETNGVAVQQIEAPYAVSLAIRDADEDEIEHLATEELRAPFELREGRLLRASLFRIDAEDHLLVIVVHHIASDAWSSELLIRELALAYEGAPLPPIPVQYADFAVWQREKLAGARLETLLAYWKRVLAGVTHGLELPSDHPRPAERSYEGGHVRRELRAGLGAALRALARSENATPFMTLLAAFQLLLSRRTGSQDVLIGTPVAGRSRRGIEGLIGCFINTLVLRGDLAGDPTFRELLARTRESCLDAFAHDELPFERLVEELRPQRDLTRNPLFQIMFALQQEDRPRFALAGLRGELVPVAAETSKFDLTLDVEQHGDDLAVRFTFALDLFESATIERTAAQFEQLLESIVADPDEDIGRLCILPDAERGLIAAFQAPLVWREERAVHEIFAERAALSPDAIAVTAGIDALTFGDLDARANRLARYLRHNGVKPDTLVALCVDRSLEMVVGMLAILKAGGAYVPIDPSYPRERIAAMIEDARAPMVLTRSDWSPDLEGCNARLVLLDHALAADESCAPLDPLHSPDSLAYVIYTSGSTGRPKGVAIPHHAITNHMLWMDDVLPLEASDRVLQKTPFSFDASVWEFFAPLIAGARLVMAAPGAHQDPASLAEEIRRNGITILQVVPSMLQILLDEPAFAHCTSLRRVFCGGEALGAELVQKYHSIHAAPLFNLYGPTECTIDASCDALHRGAGKRPVPIGKPVANTRFRILDRFGELVPIGVAGELLIGGAGLARGYVYRPDLTAQRFVPDPYGPPGARLYRTGDLARFRDDGAAEYLGRIDHQVKLRGYRIELGEIESVLQGYPGVVEVAAMVREDTPGDQRLVAYVVAQRGIELAASDLRFWMAGKVPQQMIPALFVPLPDLPRSPSGKIDRRALPQAHATRDGELVEPRTALERLLAAMWSEMFDVALIGIDDNFFALGGHSLLAAQLVSRLRKVRIDLPLRSLFEAPTVRLLAAHAAGGVAKERIEKIAGAALRLRSMGTGEARRLLANQTVAITEVTP
jgi:amino acid adenylation domain-containing protein